MLQRSIKSCRVTQKVCHCGRHTKSRSQEFCVLNESSGKVSRCPCVKKGQQCSKRCRCLNCKNKPPRSEQSEAQRACRCGEGGKTTEGLMRASCIDIPDKRRSTCPCYGSGNPCSQMCRCKGCDNFGKKQVSGQSTSRKRMPKCT